MPRTLIAALVALTAALTLTSVALAKDGDIRVTGSCTGASSAKLKLSPENGRIEVEFEVDQNRNGVAWSVALSQNGSVVVRTTAVTKAPSGSFEVRRVLANAAGPDLISAVATSPTGERCTASATATF